MHNLALSDEQQQIRDLVRKLVAEQIGGRAHEADEHRQFDRAALADLAEMGLLGLPVAEASGGAGLGLLAFAVALEEIAKGCGSTARLLLSQAGLCGKALEGIGAAAATSQALALGETLGALVGPWCGVKAREDGSGWVLSGEAKMVTAGVAADVVVVAATSASGAAAAAATGEALLFCLPAAGVEREPVPALGLRASAPGMLRLRDVRAEALALVARGGDALRACARAQLAAQIGGGAIGVGLACAAYERATKHVRERVAFGKPLFAQQAVRHKLVESMRRSDAARHLVYHAARLADAGEAAGPATSQAAMFARLDGIEAAVLAGDEAIQVLGGYGYTTEYHVERCYRDAVTLEVMDGGGEALRDAVAAGLTAER